MPDLREFQKVVESAEKAAAAGDIAAAESLLREAAELQEASHGPLHPELASTLNNLAVVCEMAHKPIEAEQFFRRAYAIASGSLSPGHPMVATARDNLREFCVARGLPVEEWMDLRTGAHVAPPGPVAAAVPAAALPAAAAPVMAAPAPTPVPVQATAIAAATPRPERPTTPTPATSRPRRGVGVAVAVVTVLAVLAGARVWRTSSSDDAAPAGATRSPSTSAAPSATLPASDPVRDVAPQATSAAAPPVPTAPVSPAPAVPPAAIRSAAPTPPAGPAAASGSTASAPAASAGVRVVTATVCSTLTTSAAWRCAAAGAATAPGRLSYYTRVASPRGLRLQHRWYQGDRLRQDVTLRIGANAVDGYRTFSRQTVAPGEWRVELRAENGALLDEARFVVR